ncbi:MAG: peptidoglycan -binding protein [Henriciella sp.]|uniref:peptidoglycan -binding protein n=1 Tax=Henriciella sp. TaxID=1968823 RepID=UPI003C71E00C
MALSRRSSNRVQNAIWPGFVDAMTGLLLVLMFVLTIFMVIQFVLREQITGQETELDALGSEVAALMATLGLERDRSAALSADLDAASAEAERQSSRIASLIAERDAQDRALADAQSQITEFEAQVAGLLSERSDALARIAGLEETQSELMSEQEALNLALADARSEIDAGIEAARLAAARREALEALVADLETQTATQEETISALEADALVDAAAAEALRERLANADTELTAMTLNLERQRREAEETLTLLAAAEAAQEELDRLRGSLADENNSLEVQLAEARVRIGELESALENATETRSDEARRQAELLARANAALAEEEALSAESRREIALLNEQITELRSQVGNLQTMLNISEEADRQAQIQIETLGAQLNTALARAVSEQRRRAELEEAERLRLEEEAERLAEEAARLATQTEDLERFRSDFFGELRQILEGQERIRIEGDRFIFNSEVLFAPGSATLSAAGEAEIANISDLLFDISAQIPDGIDWLIRVDGHTDSTPVSTGSRFEDNWELSQARALSVVRFMSEELGFDPRRLAANGFGEHQPINPLDTPEARAQNRRIELKLTER